MQLSYNPITGANYHFEPKMGLEPRLTRKQRRAIERKIKKLNSKKK